MGLIPHTVPHRDGFLDTCLLGSQGKGLSKLLATLPEIWPGAAEVAALVRVHQLSFRCLSRRSHDADCVIFSAGRLLMKRWGDRS